MSRLHALAAALLCSASALAAAQAPDLAGQPMPEEAGGGAEEMAEEVVVTGRKPEGSVVGDIAPEVTLNGADIRSYGVSSLSELLAELAPQTGSVQGRGGEGPVVLLGGRRISGFAEIRDIPTEAIQRVEILPEEVALKYGYRPTQKVVNVVLRRRFRAVTVEGQGGLATEGGRSTQRGDAGLLRIRDGTRQNLSLRYDRATPLYESERDLVGEAASQPFDTIGNLTSAVPGAAVDPRLGSATVLGVPTAAAGGAQPLSAFANAPRVTETTPYRTLLAGSDTVTLNGVLARTILGSVGASLNGTLTYSDTQSAQGLARARLTLPAGGPFSPFAGDTTLFRYLDEYDPLAQRSRTWSGHLGTTLTGQIKGGWNWTVTGTYDRDTVRTRTETGFDLTALQAGVAARDPALNPFAPLSGVTLLTDRARSTGSTGEVQGIVTGTPFRLPAGAATATLRIGGTLSDLDGSAVRSGIRSETDLSRNSVSSQASLDLPIASRKRGTLAALGELSANLNLGFERVSDFGTLRTMGIGTTWSPIRQVSLIASYNLDEGAPTIRQLGDPTISTAGVRVFDFVRGETAEIVRLTGGNPALAADERKVFKLGVTLRPVTIPRGDLSLTGNFVRSKVDNPIAGFPTATAAIEAAFPDRFTRDAAGRLLRIDSRPINFAWSKRSELRWGFNFSKQVSAPPPRRDGEGGRSWRDMLPPGGQGRPGDQAAAPGGEPRPRETGAGPGGRPGGRGFGGFGGGPGGRGTRVQAAIYHTWHIKDELLIAPGGPLLDLLGEDAIASSGGQPRHEIEAQTGITRNGLGLRVNANWQAATQVAGGVNGGELLRFSDLTTVGVRLFANLGSIESLAREHPFLRGMRVSLNVSNLLNERLRVRDSAGTTPVSYQPGYLDPLGRAVTLSVRKLFF
ncbi:hypothetical protein [Sphingomonas jatrophae]|uniref:TonB dependent receptor n=1 Tax=Sphingomonas jatrophae TaxID=1166337 RepID=A0A1I6JTI5_9SPHN|nr:hypothetical protein [Sphingomonas jatrophae]SFR82231.1 TonB dependent receptor [Sphingomonas jatrophae]